jgi:uroporphyrin-III C-methyltransferase/precorrin-2 dehydrogenase/sirohydrochlorin ferrochelatase
LADPAATTIVYMGVRTLPLLVAQVIEHGLPPSTPAVLVERASWPDQRAIYSALSELPARVEAICPTGPCLVMIGAVMAGAGGAGA